MPLNKNDIIALLSDLLNNQRVDCCGSISELEQVARLSKQLLMDEQLDNDAKEILYEVYHYCQNGIQTKNLNKHIEAHEQQLSQWVENISNLS